MPKLFAVDSMAVLYRGYFAMIRTPLINSKGLNTGGIRAFLMQLVKIIEEERPDYLAVASDSSEPTFRHKQFPQYKATREKMPEDLVEQLPYLPRLVESLNLPYLILPGFEADDIVGTLICLCREAHIEGVMVTSDKDYMQLVSETTTILNHKNELIGIPEVREKFGCSPEQVIEMLGLMGDSSDNIPGVRGVGEKTAKKLIAKFGNIQTVYQNLNKVPGKSLKDKLEAGRENALLSRELVTIACDVPLSVTLEDIHLGKTDLYDNPELHALLEELEFNTLLKRLQKKQNIKSRKPETGNRKHEAANRQPPTETEQSALEVRCSKIETLGEFQEFVKKLIAPKFPEKKTALAIALNFESGHQLDFSLLGLAFCLNPEEAVYLDLNVSSSQKTELFAEVKHLLESDVLQKNFYNLKQVTQIFIKYGLELLTEDIPENIYSDVMLAAHLTDPLERRYDLDYLLGRKLNMFRKAPETDENFPEEGQLSMFPETADIGYVEHCQNAAIILRLHRQLGAQLSQSGMAEVFRNIEIPLAKILAQLELSGVKIDTEKLGEIALEFEGRLDELRRQIFAAAGEEFNPNSVPELQSILYEKLRLHERYKVKPKKIKLGNRMSTDEETLEKLAGHLLPRIILDYRTLSKLKNTYIDQLPTFVHQQSLRIHSTFRQTGTATGRLSSENPNLQNIPIRSAEGRRVRRAFIASGTERMIVSADYSQIELRIVAHYSKDPTFMEAYRRNFDIHALTASAIFNVPEKEVTREMRSRAKEVNFGLIYRMGPERLSVVTKTSKNEAKEFIERFFQKYSTIHALQERFLEQARKEGFAETLFGRRRYLPEINGKGLLKRLAEGAAVNTPIQGSAAEIIKLAMIAVNRRLRKEQMQSRMILSVHDELVFDTPKEEIQILTGILQETMENVVALEVPLSVEVGSGETWLDAH